MKLRNVKTIGETIMGYKKAFDNHLVILEIPPSAKHNINRTNGKVKQFAKYRCSDAIVKDIVNLGTGESVNEARSIYDNCFKYTRGQKTVPGVYDPDPENVCGGGIHFFLDRKIAVLYKRTITEGEWKEWYDNGQLETQGFHKDGKREGDCKEWYDNGQLLSQGFFKDGKREGEWKEWHVNGKLYTQGFHKDGKREGEWNQWYYNGKLWFQGFYNDGEREGEWKEWHVNGQLSSQGFFKDGEREGEWKEWHVNGQLWSQGFYKDGKLQ